MQWVGSGVFNFMEVQPQDSKTSKASAGLSIGVISTLLVVVVLVHLGIAFWFASITPWRQSGLVALNRSVEKDIGAPDERQHTNYVMRLARGEGFPVFDPNDPNLYETYQSHQPPAYYVLAAGFTRLVTLDASTVNVDSREFGMKLRELNIAVGAVAIVGVFFLCFWGLESAGLGLVAAAFAGFLPMFCALCGAVSNDPLLIALCTWVLALCAKGMRGGWSWRLAVMVGLLLGIAFLTKTTALALVPAVLASAFFPKQTRPKAPLVALAAVIALAIVTPWWIRNQSLYGDPLAMGAFTQAFKGSAQKEAIVAGIGASGDQSPEMTYWKDWVGWWTARSFFGTFGYMDIWMNESGYANRSSDKNVLYRLLLVGMILSSLGWLLAVAKSDRKELPFHALCGIFLLVVVVLFARFNMQYFQAQARYILPALGPIAAGVAVGVTFLCRKKALIAFAVVAIVLVGVDMYAVQILPSAFQQRIEAAQR
jgi:4-amino-4-deoxy-L-arabinose transferase-like glycosyltransferase